MKKVHTFSLYIFGILLLLLLLLNLLEIKKLDEGIFLQGIEGKLFDINEGIREIRTD
ncbi:hypothetical protein [Peribacillus sp. Bi134]|uniref:hypothetical protein n=1 Tax=Peribacillus sp. Bi134 TaxID=2884272 RepID=UPI001DFF39EE|nr:hypothetical protein [Peribacillus sp. Bi134]CAH0142745.1 hypothetical protein SRABI134_00576 [Peribacillus sp. Bi134]